VACSKAAGPNNYGEIDVFEINSESGFMRQIPTSPFPSGGRNPVAEAISADNTNLYVVNQDDNNIVQFIIGNDGKIYPQNTVNTPGVFPLAVAVSKLNLFVVDTYQPLPTCSPAAPCAGSIAVFPITVGTTSPPSDMLQPNTPINACNGLDYVPLGPVPGDVITPTAITASANGNDVFISAHDATANTGYVFGFVIGAMSCPNNAAPFQTIPTLTAMSGSPWKAGGIQPSAITVDPSSTYVYVTDMTSTNVHGYSIASGSLVELNGSPFQAGNQPDAIVVDPSYPYLYVANALDDTVSAYSMAAGVLTSIGSYPTGLQPVAIGVDPSTNHFLFTANYLGNSLTAGSITGFELSPTAGTLINSQNSPYTANAQPVAAAAIPHNGTGGGIQK